MTRHVQGLRRNLHFTWVICHSCACVCVCARAFGLFNSKLLATVIFCVGREDQTSSRADMLKQSVAIAISIDRDLNMGDMPQLCLCVCAFG